MPITYLLVPALDTAMEVIRRLVLGELVDHPVNRRPPQCRAIADLDGHQRRVIMCCKPARSDVVSLLQVRLAAVRLKLFEEEH